MFDKRDFQLALYCASIIIGAGLLTLPLIAARVGFLPLFGLVLVVGLYMMWVYGHIADSLFAYLKRVARRKTKILAAGLRAARGGNIGHTHSALNDEHAIIADEVRERGSRQLAEQIREAGLGLAGRFALIWGMFLYVFFADIGYILIGNRSLAKIAEFLGERAPQLLPALMLAGPALMVFAWNFEQTFAKPFLLRGMLKKLLMMGGAWLFGIGLIGVAAALGVGDSALAVLGIGLFTGAVLAALYTRVQDNYVTRDDGGLNDQHMVNVSNISFEGFLLAITTIVTLWAAWKHGLFVPLYWLGSQLSNLGAWADLVGLVIFAYVGTGIFNLCAYPTLFESNGRTPRIKRVVILGTLIPMAVYLLWTLLSGLVLPSTVLSQLDAHREYSTIGIAQILGGIDLTSAILVTTFGYLVALMAVTSACNGFTESLADQLSVVVQDNTGRAKWLSGSRDNFNMRLAILVAAALVALVIDQFITINVSTILAVAGNAGGGILILILPFFLPPPGRRKSGWSLFMIGMMTAVVLWGISLNAANIAMAHDLPSLIVAGIAVAIAFSILGTALWLMKTDPEPNIDDDDLRAATVRRFPDEKPLVPSGVRPPAVTPTDGD